MEVIVCYNKIRLKNLDKIVLKKNLNLYLMNIIKYETYLDSIQFYMQKGIKKINWFVEYRL